MAIPPRCKFLHRLIMAVDVILWPIWGHAPSNKAYNNQQTYYSKGQHIVKTRKKYCYYYFYDYFWHNALTNRRAQSLPVVMVIRPMQSVGVNAAMVPHSWHRRIQQSANMLGDCSMRRHCEWVTMAATVDHSSHDALMDFCCCCGLWPR